LPAVYEARERGKGRKGGKDAETGGDGSRRGEMERGEGERRGGRVHISSCRGAAEDDVFKKGGTRVWMRKRAGVNLKHTFLLLCPEKSCKKRIKLDLRKGNLKH